ncbi:uncharacterized protein LOC124132868 isoform X2 [Haliotis rufescens]|uniref:uncharacterized protein LOC124132868 isoform X2 n=1 Tax=Haliotis rufescens TaxID=6454 RepID=UPI00201F8DB9|nr:uncharacterized protein LOC124132868 isoform X2 [Haliotis rufescens]XP_048254372.1 uncharacterized protein LOC124132868 isoform X2 [Haliotis rufescens]
MKPCHPFCRLIFITFLPGITGARLTTSPTHITIGGSNPTSQLTVRCSPDVPGITLVYNIEIGKKSSTGSNQPVIRMGSTDPSVQVVDTGLQQRMTASGSITGATGSIQFILTDLRCTDAASTYYCFTLYKAGSSGSDATTTNIAARTYPEQLEMFPTPDRGSYDNGQLISFRCTGRIGNQFNENNLQSLWTWEWRSIDNEFTSWTRYPNDQNITYETPTPVSVSGGCQYNGASTLLHTVSNLDSGRQFRCSVISEDYSDNKTVLVIGQQPPGPTSRPETSTTAICIQNSQESSLGGGVAIGVCVMLVVDAICLGLAFLFRDEIANCISGAKKTTNTEISVLSKNRNSLFAERSMTPCHTFCCLIFMTFLPGITGARLNTSPAQITIGGSSPTSQLTVRCSPDAPWITQVFNIQIGKKYTTTDPDQLIIQVSSGDSSVTVVDTSLQQRMTASGSITGATGSIQFILTDLRCTDAASTYYCKTSYLAGSAGSGNDEGTANITARTYPEQMEMFPTPDRVSYDNGQMISFRCTGRIGNQFDDNNLLNLWTWEFTSWTRYPNDQNITYDPPTPVSGSGGCQYTGASTLVHTVSDLDNGRQFRCFVLSGDKSDNKTVLVIGQQPLEPTSRPETSTTAYPEQIEMFPTPDRVSYDNGQLISFRCTGRIGNQFNVNNLQNLWTWEWRFIDNDFASWTRYPNDQNITYDPPSPVSVSGGCQNNGASTLLHTVSNLDNGRQFRCSVISEDYSDNKTVLVIGQQPPGPTSRPETSTTGQQPPGPTSRPETSTTGDDSLGVGVAIGVGVMLVVIVICLCLTFIYRNTVAGWLLGAKKTSNTETPVMSNIQTPATAVAPVGMQTQGDEYEIPVDRNHYNALQTETADIPNTYENTNIPEYVK